MVSLDLQRFAYPKGCFDHGYFTRLQRGYSLSELGKQNIDAVVNIIMQYMTTQKVLKQADMDIGAKLQTTPQFYFRDNQIHFGQQQSLKRSSSGSSGVEEKIARRRVSPQTEVEPSKSLNTEQRAAVQHKEGPMLILAGPGSGKTFVLTERVKYLVNEGGIKPPNILMVTFTKKAAREMKERLEGSGIEKVLVKTFHGFGVHLLREYLSYCGKKPDGLEPGFKIYDSEESKRIITSLLESAIAKKGSQEKPKVDLMVDQIKIAKSKRQKTSTGYGGDESLFKEVYQQYNDHLRKKNAVDFTDLLALPLQMLEENRDILARAQAQWTHLMVDEYQDTSPIQAQMVDLLAGQNRNLVVVGDPKQSIYGWRGTDSGVINGFKGKKIDLQTNYRSTQNIINQAAQLMAGTDMAESAKQTCSRKDEGKIYFHEAETCESEVDFVVQSIKKLLAQGAKAGEIAILFRTRAQSKPFELACAEEGIPFFSQVHPDEDELAFYQEKEVGNIMDLLRFVMDPLSRSAFERAILSLKIIPKGQLGKLSKINKLKSEVSWIQACNRYCSDPKTYPTVKLDKTNRNKLSAFCKKIKAISLDESDAQKTLRSAIEAFSYEDVIKGRYPKHHDEHTKLLDKLSNKAKGRSLKEFLESQTKRVRIMTLHCAKGLEFESVFLVGMEEGLLPSFRAIESNEDEGIEEERRSLYVGITRAKTHLTYTWAKRRYNPKTESVIEKDPSRFLALLKSQGSEFA